MANSKDTLFKSQVNNYIGEKLSQGATPPAFSVTDDGNGNYTISKFNGDVTLTLVDGNYVFTPTRGSAVTVAASNINSIVVDFITLNADASVIDGKTITGSGIVELNPSNGLPQADLTHVQSAVLSATIIGDAQAPTLLEGLSIGSPTVGRIIKISQGEVELNETLQMPADTSLVVEAGATLTLSQTQVDDSTSVSGQGTINIPTDTTPPAIIDPTAFTFSDTGSSTTDGVTSNGTINLTLATDTASWQYSTDSGTTWTNGTGSSFTLSNGTYDKQNIKVKQFDGAGFTGNSSISSMSTVVGMVQLEALGNTNREDYDPQITALSDGGFAVTFYGYDSTFHKSVFVQKFNSSGVAVSTMVQLEAIGNTTGDDTLPQITALLDGSFVVTFYGYDSEGDRSVFVQKFNSSGVAVGSMVQLEAIGKTDGHDYTPQITALTNGEFAVTFYGMDSDGEDSIFVQKFNIDGATVGSMVQLEAIGVTSYSDYNPQITTLTNGEFVVTFYGRDSIGGRSIFVQKFNIDGATVGSMVQLGAINVTTNNSYDPQITALLDGGFAVTFYGFDSAGDFSVFVQKFNSSGVAVSTMVQLEAIDIITGSDRAPQITALSDGGFAVTFHGLDSVGDDSIFVQKFNADGTTTGSMVQLEAIGVTNSGDWDPQITALINGEFAVTFYGVDSGGDFSVFVQKFNSSGAAVGSMVQLEALGVTNAQDMLPQVSAIGTSGEFMVTFSGIDTDGDYSIFVQRFNADGTAVNNTLVIDSTTPTAATINPITSIDINNDSTGVYAAGDKIAFAFSEPIHVTTLTLTDITLSNSHSFSSGATLTALNTSNGFASNFEIALGTTPTVAANDTLTIASSKAVDVAGNANSSGIAYTVPAITAVATPTFTATNTSGVITFDGTATGNISLAIDSGTVTFTKGSVTAATTVALADITKITLAAGQTIADSAADLTKPIDGAGNVVVTGTAGEDVLYIYTSGTNSITGGTGSEMIWLGDENLGVANEGVDTLVIGAGSPTQTETHTLTFQNLTAGQSVTVDGLTLTATGDITAAAVAAGFANLSGSVATGNAVTNGTWSSDVYMGSIDTSGSAYDVTISTDGSYAYVADGGSGLQIIDTSDPLNPTLKSTIDTSGYAEGIRLSADGSYAYAADGYSGLQIIDISDPLNPTLKSTIDTSGYARGVTLSADGSYAYVADYGSGLQIIDISDPLNPTLKSTIDTSGYAEGVTLSADGSYAYVADNYMSLQIIDISDPLNPTLKSTIDTSGSAWGVTLSADGSYAYVADSGSGLQIIDISDPLNPTLKSTIDTSGSAWGVTLSADGSYAYVADSGSGLQIIDISDPLNPTLKSTIDTSGSAWGVTLSADGSYAYVANRDGGLQIIDLTADLFSSKWTSGAASGATVTFISETSNTNVEDLVVSTDGAAINVVSTQGGAIPDSSPETPDQIVYFELTRDKLDLLSTTIATTSTDVADVTVGGVTVGKTTITNGIATFQGADNATSVTITSADALGAALGYLSGAIIDTETVAFTYDLGSGNSGTYIFQGGATGDIVVDLIGVSVTGANLTAILI